MTTPRLRTAVVALLVAVVAVRVSVSQPVTASVARIAGDPTAALRAATGGWSGAGTLGSATAQGLRELPLALHHWLGSQLGLGPQVLQTVWQVLVLLLALAGALRLARALAGPDQEGTWTPWVAAALFSSGIVVVPAVVRSPLDGLAAATLPWVVAPLLTGRPGWRRAAASAAWLGLAGVGSPSWAATALVAALVAAFPRSRHQVVPALRWLVLAALSCAWWVSAYVWESVHSRDVSALLVGDGVRGDVAAALGRPDLGTPLVLLVVLGPLVVTASTLLLRPPGVDRVFLAALGGAALVAGATALGGWEPPVFAASASHPPAALVAALGWLALTALVAWTPLVSTLGDRLRPWSGWRPSGRQELAVGLTALLVLVTTAAGAMAAAADREGADESRPDLATQVATWSEKASPGRVLVLPPRPEGAQGPPSLGAALGGRPWVGRDARPPSGAAGTSALDVAIARLGRGDGGTGTSEALRRLGIAYVLLHLDGVVTTDRANPSALVRAALVEQGASRVAHLAARDATAADGSTRRLLDSGLRSGSERVEIWSLPEPADGWVRPGRPVDVAGDAGTTSDLADAGMLGARALRFRDGAAEGVAVLSDSARRQDVDQRVARDPYGPVVGPKQPRTVVPRDAAPVTTATRRYAGARSVSASSSAADLGGPSRRLGADATAAVDGNVFTSWQSRAGTGTGQWWEIELEAPTDLAGTTVQLVRSFLEGHSVSSVRVRTDQQTRDYEVGTDGVLTLEGAEQSKRLRITVTDVAGAMDANDSVGIAEVRVPGVTVRDQLLVSGPAPQAWLLAARTGSHTRCVPPVPTGASSLETVDASEVPTVCDPGVSVPGPDSGSLDRAIVVDEPTTLTGHVRVRAAATGASASLVQRLARPSVTATGSSVVTQDLVTRPQAAVDGDTSTSWRPAPGDTAPALDLTWRRPTQVTGVELVPATGDVASVPTRVRVAARTAGGKVRTVDADVSPGGRVVIPRVRTRSLTLTFLERTEVRTVSSATTGKRPMPIAVAEVGLVGGPEVRYDADRTRRLGCGSGPTVSIDGKAVQTDVSASAGELAAGAVVRADLCAKAEVSAGEVEVGVPASFSWTPVGIALGDPRAGLPGLRPAADDRPTGRATAVTGPVLSREQPHRPFTVRLDVSDAEQTLALAVPAGTGWEARGDGARLRPVTVDGWSQAWAVPAGVDRVQLSYSAGGSLRLWSGLGALGWALVLLLAVSGSLSYRWRWLTRSR